MSTPVQTHALSKSFRGTTALDSLTLEIPEGSIYGLVGPNGAGKTTALKILMNIHQPTAGSSTVLGVDSRRLAPAEFAQIGYVSENQEMPEWMTVQYYLDYLANFYPSWDRDLAIAMLQQFQLPAARKLSQLSRGMKMKAALVSSLAYRPKLIVLDEPFNGLDPLVRDEFIEGLLGRSESATILISSHDLAEMETFASHLGYLTEGCLAFSEELESLGARFREVVLTFDGEPTLPKPWPGGWHRPEIAGPVVRYVDSQFDGDAPERVRAAFPPVRDMAFNPMPLRSIFVSLARAGRHA